MQEVKGDESPDKMLSGDICGWQEETERGEGKDIREEGERNKERKRMR